MPHILIVEDSPTQAEQVRLTLQSEGFAVDVAPDGRTGLEQLRHTPFDLILSDVMMPELSGYELCRQVKTDPSTRHIPVVLLTQLTDPLDVLHGLECGADNFITKPCDANHLVRRLRTILANNSQHAAGTPGAGTVLSFRGTGVTITTDKEQILDLLLATVEEVGRSRGRERAERAAKENLEKQAAELTESGRRKDQHLALLAHELRNPLAPLLTSLHVLRRADTDSPTREQSLDRMERQLQHLSRLLDSLLDASRVVQGKVRLRPERLDLARLVGTTAEDRRLVLEEAGLTLAIETPETPVWVKGDPTRLAQVLTNLLDNAAKFTDRGGRVNVGLVVDESLHQAIVTVRDTGVGIEPAMLPRLFDTFAQGDPSLDRSRGGLGLGLAVVKGLLELHGGQVQAASPGPGRGAEFTVRLAVQREPGALSVTRAAPSAARERLRVLVVEDNRDAADSLRMLLQLTGHEAKVAYTGPEGVQAAKEWTPDIVLCDIGLPGLDGYGVARALRLHPTTARTRLVALTGYGSDEDRRRSRQAGFDEHLTKPAEPQALLELLVPLR